MLALGFKLLFSPLLFLPYPVIVHFLVIILSTQPIKAVVNVFIIS